MTCATCQNIRKHQSASQFMYRASQGFCGCALQPAYVYMARLYERQCADYVKVAG